MSYDAKYNNVIRKRTEIRNVLYDKEMKTKKVGHLRRWNNEELKDKSCREDDDA